MSRSLRRSEEVLSRCALHSSRCPYMHVRAAWAHHVAQGYVDAYLEVARIGEDRSSGAASPSAATCSRNGGCRGWVRSR